MYCRRSTLESNLIYIYRSNGKRICIYDEELGLFDVTIKDDPTFHNSEIRDAIELAKQQKETKE